MLFQIFKTLISALFFLILTFLVAFLVIVYPNDKRIPQVLEYNIDPTQQLTKITSLITGKLDHQINLSIESYKPEVKKLEKTAFKIITQSKRFTSPYQIYFSTGSFPEFMQGKDALFIPSGAKLTIHPKLDGEYTLSFSSVSILESSNIEIYKSQTLLNSISTPQLSAPLNTQAPFYNNVIKYLKVNPATKEHRWSPNSQKLTLTMQDTLTFRCHNKTGLGCIISDPSFYSASDQTLKTPRNTIVFMIDTFHKDSVTAELMPHLRNFADKSQEFTQAIAPGNMTGPSTNSFLTCLKASDISSIAFSYAVPEQTREEYYTKKIESFPETLRKNGFYTAAIGYISLVSEVNHMGVYHGFEEEISIERDSYSTPRITNEVNRWLSANNNRSFFLYAQYDGGHGPYRAPLEYLLETFPGIRAFYSSFDMFSWLYRAELKYTDDYLKPVFDHIKKLGLDKNTDIYIIGDHADQITARRFFGNQAGPSYYGAYFDHGATLLNDEVIVPFIWKQAGYERQISTGNRVTTNDIGPTVLARHQLSPMSECIGKDLSKELDSNRVIGSEGFRQRSVYFGDYKYIKGYETTQKRLHSTEKFASPKTQVFIKEQLYNLAIDPHELNNLSGTSIEKWREATKVYRDYYGFEQSFELILESPETVEVKLIFANNPLLEVDDNIFKIDNSMSSETLVSGHFSGRTLIKLSNWDMQLPQVFFDGIPDRLYFTRLKLPIDILPRELPPEMNSPDRFYDNINQPKAYLSKVEDDNMQVRKIATGNLEFEKILRQWGYLLDDSE